MNHVSNIMEVNRAGLGYAPASASRQLLQTTQGSHAAVSCRSKVRCEPYQTLPEWIPSPRAPPWQPSPVMLPFQRTWAVRSGDTAVALLHPQSLNWRHGCPLLKPYDRPMDMATQRGGTPEDYISYPLPSKHNKPPSARLKQASKGGDWFLPR